MIEDSHAPPPLGWIGMSPPSALSLSTSLAAALNAQLARVLPARYPATLASSIFGSSLPEV
jgi:hypothetical protein